MNPPQMYMCSQSWTPLPPQTIPLGHPSAPAPSILYPASNLDWRFVSYMILYMFHLLYFYIYIIFLRLHLFVLVLSSVQKLNSVFLTGKKKSLNCHKIVSNGILSLRIDKNCYILLLSPVDMICSPYFSEDCLFIKNPRWFDNDTEIQITFSSGHLVTGYLFSNININKQQ